MDPKVAEIILNSPDCINKTFIMDVIKDMIGDGLLTSKTPRWNIHRKLLNPSFNYKVLLSFFPLFNDGARELCEKLDELVGCGEVDLDDHVFCLSIRQALATTMGLDSKDNFGRKLKECYEKLIVLTVDRALNPLALNSTLFRLSKKYKPFKECEKYVNDFVQKLVTDKITASEFESPEKLISNADSFDIKKESNIFIEQAIKVQQRNEFTAEDIITESKLMVLAAYETSATALLTILVLLAMHPQIQEKVFDEILAVFPEEGFDVRIEDFQNLKYLDMCINEALRIHPSIPIIGRSCTKDIQIAKDIVVPKGTQIAVDIFNMQRDEDIWGPKATSFDPDHFLPANLVDLPKNAFMAFSLGPRNCIGWQYAKISLRVSLTQIIRKYRFSTHYRFEDLKCMPYLTLKYETLPGLEVYRR